MNKGIKHDSEKLRMDLIPVEVLEELAIVLTHGAEKYHDNNWQNVGKDRYIAALLRHYVDWRKGEVLDKDSGLRHLSHMLTNISFLLWKEINNEK